MKNLSRKNLITLLLPSFLFIIFVFAVPIFYSIFISLHHYNILLPYHPFVGFKNYIKLSQDSVFWSSLKITLYFVVVAVAIELSLAMLIALLLNQDFKGREFLRVILMVPWAVPWVVNGIMWKWIFNSEFGVLNKLLLQIGIIGKNIKWLGKPFLALNMMIFADVWKETPFIAILLLAGLQAIPIDYYEAAEIEGANSWVKFCRITLPLLKPVTFVALSLRTIWAFKSFDLVYALTQGGPSQGTNLLNFYIYQTTFSHLDFGYGATLSLVLTIIILVITLLFYKFILTEEE